MEEALGLILERGDFRSWEGAPPPVYVTHTDRKFTHTPSAQATKFYTKIDEIKAPVCAVVDRFPSGLLQTEC